MIRKKNILKPTAQETSLVMNAAHVQHFVLLATKTRILAEVTGMSEAGGKRQREKAALYITFALGQIEDLRDCLVTYQKELDA